MAKEVKKNAPKLSEKSIDELKKDLLEARHGLYDGTLANPHHIKSLRKEIARKMTKGDK